MTTTTTSAAALEGRFLIPVYKHLSVEPVRGSGVELFDAAGRRFLDLYGGHAVALLGYGHPRLIAALDHQARELFFQSNAVALELRARAAQALVELSGLDLAFLVNSGAEANENALRLAFRKTGRKRIVALEGAFHGRTAAAAAVSHGSARWYAFPRKPFEVTFVPRHDLEALEKALGDDVAALIVEPIQGLAGAYALGADYLQGARQLTEKVGALLICDEVQSGLGRSGAFLASQLSGVEPDLVTLGKGIAGGLPAAAVLMRRELSQGIGLGDLGTTFGGGPLACALIEAVMTELRRPELLDNVRKISDRIVGKCQIGPVIGWQGQGLLLGLRTARPAKEVQSALLERGIMVGNADDPHIIRLLPPLILEEGHVDELAAALAEIE